MREKHCKTCVCGLTKVEWSDREAWIDLEDVETVATTVVWCAYGHCYDRPATGVPFGLPRELEEKLIPIVAAHLEGLIGPGWEDKTIDWQVADRAREGFWGTLVEALR